MNTFAAPETNYMLIIMLCLSRLLLRKEGVNFRTTAEFEIVRTIKEKCCYLANQPLKEEALDSEKLQFTLPDGSKLEVRVYIVCFLHG